MATPSRSDVMIRNIVARKRKAEKEILRVCLRQFPDCPNAANKEFCAGCPYWK